MLSRNVMIFVLPMDAHQRVSNVEVLHNPAVRSFSQFPEFPHVTNLCPQPIQL